MADKRLDASRAFQRARLYHAELREIHKYFMPFRAPTSERSGVVGERSEGQATAPHMFDGTGPSSAFAFVSNMKADWLPAFQDFFQLKNGPLYRGEDQEKRTETLQKVTQIVHGTTQEIRATVTEEMFSDLFAGTGALVLDQGDARKPIRGYSVPVTEIALDNGPWGNNERWFWQRKRKTRDIESLWPDADIPRNLQAAIRNDRNGDVDITQYTYLDRWTPGEPVYRTCVWSPLDEQEIWSTTSRTSPWITPRLFVVPGESMGRGFAHLGLPFVKTVNKARELSLRAAAFALLGLWTYRADNVFNPKNAKMTPGAFWKVASTGGQLGPSLQRLEVPKNFDISTVVINDEREQIRRVLMDDELPDLADKVRSPTEISARLRRYERSRGGATTRLAFELVTPFVERSIEILGQRGLLPSSLQIDAILTEAEVKAPAAAAQRSDRVDRMVSWLQMMTGLVGPRIAALNAAMEDILPEIGRDLGVDERFIRKKTQMEQLQALIDDAVQEALKAAKGAPATAPVAEAPSVQQLAAGGY